MNSSQFQAIPERSISIESLVIYQNLKTINFQLVFKIVKVHLQINLGLKSIKIITESNKQFLESTMKPILCHLVKSLQVKIIQKD